MASIKRNILMGLVASVAVTGAAIAVAAYLVVHQGMTEAVRRQMALAAEHAAMGVTFRIQRRRDILAGIAQGEAAEKFMAKHQYTLLEELFDRNRHAFAALRFVDVDGHLRFEAVDSPASAGGLGTSANDLSVRDATVIDALAGPGHIVSSVATGTDGTAMLRMSLGVRDYFDVMRGAFSVDADIMDLTEDLDLHGSGAMTTLLLDSRGRMLSMPAGEDGLQVLDLDGGLPDWLVRSLAEPGAAFGSVRIGKVDAYLYLFPVAGTQWHAAAIQSVAQAEEQWRSMRLVAVLTSGAIMILAAVVSWPLARRISRPLSDLARAADTMAAGDFPSHLAGGVDNEVRQLTVSFNRMVDKVQATRLALERSRDDLDERVRERTAELLREIDERKRYERALSEAKDQAEAASHAKTEFLANMSHEIRTPLNGILGMLQFIQMSDLDEQQQEDVDVALQSCMRLNALLGDILDLSRIEAGRMVLAEREFSPRAVMDSVHDLFRLNCEQMGLSFEVQCHDDVPAMVVGDEQRLRQILVNLVGNAVKFTPKGGIVLLAETVACKHSQGVRILFSVIDTGKGIPDDRMEELFEPFTQLEGEYTRKAEGAGLGLGIVKRLVGLMDGNMCVSSELGKGTTFYLALPFGRAEAQVGGDAGPSLEDFDGQGRTVLLVEDDAVNKLAVSGMLGMLGLEVRVASDGAQALEMLAQGGIDVIVMDVQLPSMDGLEATRRIRKDPALAEFAHTPIIAMTAHSLETDRTRFLQGGMDYYVSKPVALVTLADVLAKALADS